MLALPKTSVDKYLLMEIYLNLFAQGTIFISGTGGNDRPISVLYTEAAAC